MKKQYIGTPHSGLHTLLLYDSLCPHQSPMFQSTGFTPPSSTFNHRSTSLFSVSGIPSVLPLHVISSRFNSSANTNLRCFLFDIRLNTTMNTFRWQSKISYPTLNYLLSVTNDDNAEHHCNNPEYRFLSSLLLGAYEHLFLTVFLLAVYEHILL